MIPRYTLPPFDSLWTDHSKFSNWLKVELAVLSARMELGEITPAALEAIRASANFTVEHIETLEVEYDHDLISFVVCVQEYITQAGPIYFRTKFFYSQKTKIGT